MTLAESIFAAFIAGNPNFRVYPDELPQTPLLPASVYTIIAANEEQDLVGVVNGLLNAHVQVDTYATTRLEAESVSYLGRSQLLAAPDMQVWIAAGGDGIWGFETGTRLHRVMREYSIWKNR
jgi:hypothetical protein